MWRGAAPAAPEEQGPSAARAAQARAAGEASITSARSPSMLAPWSVATMPPRATMISSGSRFGLRQHAMNGSFRLALEAHQQGFLDQAARLYLKVLGREPEPWH